MGKLQKISTEQQINIFESLLTKHVPLNKREPEMKNPQQESQRDRSWESSSVSPKLVHNTPDEIDLVRKGSSIRSARCASEGGITDIGGSGRWVGASRNSIANDKLLDSLSKAISSKEATAEEKRASKAVRQMKQDEYKAAHSPQIGDDAPTQKGANITSVSAQSVSPYRAPMGKISIFDNFDHERVKPLPGETMEKRETKKDTSWQHGKKASTMQDATNRYIDDISNQPQPSNNKNLHKSATDRLFETLTSDKSKQKE